MKKKEITLQDIFNKMEELNANFTNRINHLSDVVRGFIEEDNKTTEPLYAASEYVTISEDGVYVNLEPTTKYHGEDIYRPYMCVAYFKEARDIIREEYGYELKAIHCLQSSTEGTYAEPGSPVPDKKGTFCWVRCVYLDKDGKSVASRWVFNNGNGSASNCASDCANDCGNYVQNGEAMRAGLFGSVAN